MANNLRVFNLISDYNETELVKPSVSFVVENGKVYYDDVPSPTFQGKWLATYQDSHTQSAECDSSSAITIGEMSIANLVSVEIGDCVTTISEGAFGSCTGLTSIDIPSGVTSIGEYAFIECTSLTSLTVNATTPPALGFGAFDGSTCPILVPSQSVEAYKTASGWSDYADRIQCIQPTFQGKWKATYQDSHVESAECDSSSAITQNEINKTNLVSVEIGDCVTSIGYKSFHSCSSLTSIDIPDSVTSIDSWAFFNCSGLTSISIPNSVTSIGTSAFNQCTGLTSCTIGNSVTSIGNMVFWDCSSLTSIVIPNSVTSIGDNAFSNCRSLIKLVIPSSVTYIGIGEFNGCSSLTSVTVEATTPPALGNDAFWNSNNCPIYVPSQSVEAYKSAFMWSNYALRIFPIS